MEVREVSPEEWDALMERMSHGGPPTADDVSITPDGRRLDSKERVLEWVADLDALRVAEEAAGRVFAHDEVAAFFARRQGQREAGPGPAAA